MEIKKEVQALYPQMILWRRDFHKHAEVSWTEFRTTSIIADHLEKLGYEITMGQDIHVAADRMGMPSEQFLEDNYQKALEQGAIEKYLPRMRGGFTGVIATLNCGAGPVTTLRFDIDALYVNETDHVDHRPQQEGFKSLNSHASHACAHDGHAAIGMAVAQLLMNYKSQLRGNIRIIFQAAEEGVRGAKSLVSKGLLADVDYLLGMHLISGKPLNYMAGGRSDFLATTKFDATFVGAPSHAGGSPERGKNALVAAATAVLNLYAIPRHSGGATRINIGQLDAGTGRNVIAPQADLAIETRGVTTELNDYMYQKAVQILQKSADMYECKLAVKEVGAAKSGFSDLSLVNTIVKIAQKHAIFEEIVPEPDNSLGSEDFTYMMEAVQNRGGKVSYIDIGADLGGWAHHTANFDFAEEAMPLAVELMIQMVLALNH